MRAVSIRLLAALLAGAPAAGQTWTDQPPHAALPLEVANGFVVPTGAVRLRYRLSVLREEGWRYSLPSFGLQEDIPLDLIRDVAPVVPHKRVATSHVLGIAWGAASGWQANLQVPLYRFRMEALLADDTPIQENADGIGDVLAGVRRQVAAGEGQRFDVGLDVSVPTGSLAPSAGSDSAVLSYGNRPGSGSWGVVSILTYVGQHPSASWGAQVALTRWLGANDRGYRPAHRERANAWLGWRWFDGLASTLRLEYERVRSLLGTDPALDPGVNPLYDPVTVPLRELDLTMGLSALPTRLPVGTRAIFEVRMPLYMEVIGLRRRWSLAAGLELALGADRV